MPFGAVNLGELLVWVFLAAIVIFGLKGGNNKGGGSTSKPPSE